MKTRLTERDLTRIIRRVINEEEPDLPSIKICDPAKFDEFMNSVAQINDYPMSLQNAPDGKKEYILLTFPDGQRCAIKKKNISFGI